MHYFCLWLSVPLGQGLHAPGTQASIAAQIKQTPPISECISSAAAARHTDASTALFRPVHPFVRPADAASTQSLELGYTEPHKAKNHALTPAATPPSLH